ncbi:MAG: hypothetical protein K8R92_00910 [Planctomycetes bacterium]|nr:hypothetical protein [Planctomycetota bacterium]
MADRKLDYRKPEFVIVGEVPLPINADMLVAIIRDYEVKHGPLVLRHIRDKSAVLRLTKDVIQQADKEN